MAQNGMNEDRVNTHGFTWILYSNECWFSTQSAPVSQPCQHEVEESDAQFSFPTHSITFFGRNNRWYQPPFDFEGKTERERHREKEARIKCQTHDWNLSLSPWEDACVPVFIGSPAQSARGNSGSWGHPCGVRQRSWGADWALESRDWSMRTLRGAGNYSRGFENDSAPQRFGSKRWNMKTSLELHCMVFYHVFWVQRYSCHDFL